MTVHVINLEFRKDRMEHFDKQAKEHGFDYVRWEAIYDKKNTKKAINKSHKQVVKYAQENNLREICVCEDDLKILHPEGFKYFIECKPKEFDLYCGILFVGETKDGKACGQFSGGTTIYFIHQRFYEFFLSIEENSHVDREVSKYSKQFDFYVTPKIWCTQLGGFSDNSRKTIASYGVYLQNREHL